MPSGTCAASQVTEKKAINIVRLVSLGLLMVRLLIFAITNFVSMGVRRDGSTAEWAAKINGTQTKETACPGSLFTCVRTCWYASRWRLPCCSTGTISAGRCSGLRDGASGFATPGEIGRAHV